MSGSPEEFSIISWIRELTVRLRESLPVGVALIDAEGTCIEGFEFGAQTAEVPWLAKLASAIDLEPHFENVTQKAVIASATGAAVFTDEWGVSGIAVPLSGTNHNQTELHVLVYPLLIANDSSKLKAALTEKLQRIATRGPTLVQALDLLPIISDLHASTLTGLLQVLARQLGSSSLEVKASSAQRKSFIRPKSFRGFEDIVAQSAQMTELFEVVKKISKSDATVLIEGENGTGKELVAQAIYRRSSRSRKRYVTVNCGALSESLLTSELFGHVRGAFTGADQHKQGLFEVASGGTLFLDEIGDTPPSMQVKLLRVLQEGVYTPVGSTDVKKCDVRIVAATHRDLRKMVAEGSFREDLYYRLNVIRLAVPALRERPDDLPLLCRFFLDMLAINAPVPKAPKLLSTACAERIAAYPWPGNVRQLQNELERLFVLSGDDLEISEDVLSDPIRAYVAPAHQASKAQAMAAHSAEVNKDDAEKRELRSALERLGGNVSQLARELGMSRSGLVRRLERYGLTRTTRKTGS